MRRTLALAFFACNHPPQEVTVAPETPSATQTAVASTTASAPTATVTATATATAPKKVSVRARCSAGQLNTPCVFERGSDCFVRHSNCTGLPCTESAPEKVDCGVFTSASPASACDVVEKCNGVSDEGCTVSAGTCNPMRTCIKQSCESAILSATSCAKLPANCVRQ